MSPLCAAAIGTVQFLGTILTVYGLLRESFAHLATHRPFGEGRFGEGAFGNAPRTRRILAFGMWLGLLPKDGQLSVTDHARNATLAIVGVVLYLLATAMQLLSIWRVVIWPR